ncbi:H-2 class I histocompatibility antigen, Q10 alpha chain-like isoform X2 [Mesoplodon densirostris]|uniref:H-2 class I histocompatibility antigen, Q10 alpha chain-like isoform X2 n=1 Tax=Mesoplodon densirostris TaxID=48708 RepID=UPI0028DBB913|nr:H-2 class I histocompatibility antigen, Q10 alpha chain-like isoform X2 [Mesoplodon densirostris]
MKTDSTGTGTLGQRVRLPIRWPQSPGSARDRRSPPPPPLLLLLLLELVREGAAESPWGLPLVADSPAARAKAVMAELAHLKLEKKPWPTRTHSLHYYYLTLSEPGPSLPKFLAVGYVDDQPFIRFDSRVGKAEPQAPWMTSMDAQYWETETRKQEKWAEVQQVEMWTVMGYHNHSSGMHSTQRMFGCEIQEDGRYRGFWQFGYDGQDHLSLDLETLSWVSAEPVAMRTKHWWETERCYAEYDKAYLEGPCLASLHRYLELGGQRFSRRDPPTVRITEHSAKDGGTTLRCWALGFYPHNILLSWWLGEKELDSENAETRPSGDGTYQTWAAVWVPAGEKAQYTCHVQHSSLNHTFTVSWESSHPGPTAMVISLILVLLVVVGGVILTKCIQGGEDPHNCQSPARAGATQLIC